MLDGESIGQVTGISETLSRQPIALLGWTGGLVDDTSGLCLSLELLLPKDPNQVNL